MERFKEEVLITKRSYYTHSFFVIVSSFKIEIRSQKRCFQYIRSRIINYILFHFGYFYAIFDAQSGYKRLVLTTSQAIAH